MACEILAIFWPSGLLAQGRILIKTLLTNLLVENLVNH